MTQHRGGDATVIINGETRTLRLTLGALAALEENLGEGDFAKLQEKLGSPRVADLLLILQALLQGGGALFSLEALKASDIDLSDAASAIAKAFRSLAASREPTLSPVFGGEGRVRGTCGESCPCGAAPSSGLRPPSPPKTGEKEEKAGASS